MDGRVARSSHSASAFIHWRPLSTERYGIESRESSSHVYYTFSIHVMPVRSDAVISDTLVALFYLHTYLLTYFISVSPFPELSLLTSSTKLTRTILQWWHSWNREPHYIHLLATCILKINGLKHRILEFLTDFSEVHIRCTLSAYNCNASSVDDNNVVLVATCSTTWMP